MNFNMISMHFGFLRTNPFSTVCHYLKNLVFDEVQQFLIAQHHRKTNMYKNEQFKLQSNFCITFENINRHKLN